VFDEEKGPVTMDIGPPPDGGREAWLCVLSTFLLLFCIHGVGEYHSHLGPTLHRRTVPAYTPQ
jgi:hypothetical protein